MSINKKFDLKYLVDYDNQTITLFSQIFVSNNKSKCHLIINENESELKQKYTFSKTGEQITTLVITEDNINFTKMFSNYSYSHFTGGFDTDYNPYLVDISGLENLDVSEIKT